MYVASQIKIFFFFCKDKKGMDIREAAASAATLSYTVWWTGRITASDLRDLLWPLGVLSVS